MHTFNFKPQIEIETEIFIPSILPINPNPQRLSTTTAKLRTNCVNYNRIPKFQNPNNLLN